jgi:capsular exopolysaccharide synthesis family protein
VLVVDCDLRRPRIDKIFAVNNEAGLADFLVGATAADAVILATSIPNVYVLPAGSAANGKTAIPMLSSHRMQELVNALRAHFDIVLYDTPPVLGVSETAVLARDVGQSFMVIQHRRYPRHMSRRARQIIDQSGGKLLGVLINSVEVTQADTFFYYHHQYEDYLRAPDTRRGTAQPAAGPGPKGGDEIQLAGKY